jgi:hypothetical protein
MHGWDVNGPKILLREVLFRPAHVISARGETLCPTMIGDQGGHTGACLRALPQRSLPSLGDS